MTKQEFLAMSLPYDVKVIDKFDCIWTIHAYKDALDNLRDNEHLSYENFIMEEGHRLILHPLSDLTKPIEHKGEKFIPIVELARMAWKEPLINKFKINNGTLWYNFDGDEYYFEFRPNKGFLFARMTPYESFMPIDNQLGLYQKLIEWHFDIADLLSKEEAIDVNTLEENPYK